MEGRRQRAPHRSYPRIARINALLREVLADEVERLADVDERLRLLTLTGVVCESSLGQAVVYLASLPPEAAEALEEHRKALQRVVGAEVRMKRTPLLSFVADPAVAAGEAVEAALRRAKPVTARDDDVE